MFRANVYSMEPLTPVAREAINDGIGMVAAYMGQTVASRELLVRLPLNERGNVNPARVGFNKLDKMVELHLMAVPLDPGAGERIGLAGVGRGWSFVDTAKDSDQVIRTTTAHEVAHAFGFVSPSAEQTDPESPFHCCDGNCIMHKMVTILVSEAEAEQQAPEESRRLLSKIPFRRKSKIVTPEPSPTYSVTDQYDFCLPCKIDLRDNSEAHMSELRTGRLFGTKGVR